jgi:hypothetical protein
MTIPVISMEMRKIAKFFLKVSMSAQKMKNRAMDASQLTNRIMDQDVLGSSCFQTGIFETIASESGFGSLNNHPYNTGKNMISSMSAETFTYSLWFGVIYTK